MLAPTSAFEFKFLLVGALFLCCSSLILPAVKDTTLESYSRLGSYEFLLVGRHAGYPKKRFVVQFQDIPRSCRRVLNATMVLKYSHSHQVRGAFIAPGTRVLCAHQILRSWNEQTIGHTTYMSPVSDYNSQCLGRATLLPWPDKGTLVRMDITQAAMNWINGAQNYGILVRDIYEDVLVKRDRRFYSSEAASASRPYLEVVCGPTSCGTPNSLLNGQRSYNSTTVGSTVTYTCNTGYRMTAGSSSRTCEANGQWSGSHPTCSLICGTPSSLFNGQRNYRSNTVGSRVTYTCNSGYRMTAGSSSRTCQSNGQWSGSHPACSRYCGSPGTVPVNGSRIITGYTEGHTVTYTCNTGYSLSGVSSRRCQSNGLWSGNQPTCPRSCGTPSSLSYGRRSYTGITVGYSVAYKCYTNYKMTAGSSSRTCQTNGQWSGSHPTCSRYCGDPGTPVNGSRSSITGRGYTEGHKVTYTCNIGYRLSGSATRMCQSNGLWSGSTVTCPIVTCVELSVPSNGQRTYLDVGRKFSNRVEYSCNTGYILSGSHSRTCQSNGEWSGTSATCHRSCGNPRFLSNGRSNYSSTTVGSRVTYTCNTGYRVTSGSTRRTCQSDGQWSGQHPTCSRSCGYPSRLPNGHLDYSSITEGSTVALTCSSGYILSGDSFRICQSNGQWSNEQPKCIRSCGAPSSLSNGQSNYTSITVGSIVTYTCEAGYKLTGVSRQTCQSNGQWSDSQPSCDRDCGTVQAPANGRQFVSGTTVGHSVNYTCNPGYNLLGNSIRTCQDMGQWSGTPPSCSRDCGAPHALANGSASYSGTTVGHTVTYNCSTGYTLIGSSNRTCQNDGQWSGSQPSCSRDCRTISPPANGRTYVSGTTVGYTVTYYCNPEYKLIGLSNRTCQENGEWSGTPPSCSRLCSSLHPLTNGRMSVTGNTEGRTVTYTCDPQYALLGNSSRTCQEDGQWSDTQPACSRDCGVTHTLPNAKMSATGTTVGHTVTYNCTTGYKLIGSSSRTCQSNGQWSGTQPYCSRDCGVPDTPANGSKSVSFTTVGHTVTYTCKSEYKLLGSSSRICQNNGQWSGTQPSCSRDCGATHAPANARTFTSGTTVGHTVTYRCNPRYRIMGNSTRTCQSNGQWSGFQPSCALLNCVKIAKLQNGQVSIRSTQGIAEYECNTGYELVGENVRKCQVNGDWSGTPPQCIDLNECESGLHSCNPNTSECFNTPGSFTCQCVSGFEDSVNSKNESICQDIDECKTTQAGNCDHRCGNTLGSYQCYCNEGYSLQGSRCKRNIPPCAEEQLPVPANGSVNCTQRVDHVKCTLTCNDNFKFGISEDFSLQYCRDGVWDYQRDQVEIPDCQPIKKRILKIAGYVESNETCLVRQNFRKYNTNVTIHKYIEAKCKQSASQRKRSTDEVGILVITFTFTEEIPFNCNFDCLDRIGATLRFQFFEVQRRVASGLALSVTNLETSELVNISLQGELQADNGDPQITCTLGQVLSQDQEVCISCAPGSFFNNSGPAAKCDPCPFHHYQNESEQTECKACPNGTFTIARGSNGLGLCRAPCSPGTASLSGLAPCEECKKGFYQPSSGANFCHKCDFGQITHGSGSTRKADCGCPAGTYWNDCLEKCPCTNGGICELDGTCICPRGLTGPYCTKQGDIPPCAEEQLPVPGNGSVDCEKIENGLKCKIKCHPMFKFGSSEDFSPQYCHSGMWDFQRDNIEIPDCQPIKQRVLKITGYVQSNETCLARQRYKEIRGEDAPVPAYITAQCKQSAGRHKRSGAEVGTLVLTFTFSEEIPFDCDFDCLDRISWTLRFQLYEVQWRVSSGLALSATNLETSELVNFTFQGELQADNDDPQITCTLGQILSEDQEVCVPCGPGNFFNNSGPVATCDPCPFHQYQNENEQTECKACPNGTFTIARGSNGLGLCRAPCSPGTASLSGLAPCEECKKGFYQPSSGANFCHKCDFGQITHSSGSTKKEDCVCPAGTYWNECLEKCPCTNGGICELNGTCICPPGLTGPYCTTEDPYHACQDTYLISFWKNGDNPLMRHIFALTGSNNGSFSVTMKLDDSTPQVSHYQPSSHDHLDLKFLPIMTAVVHISASRGVSVLGDIENEQGGDTFTAFPVSPLLGEREFEEYLILSHANKVLQTNFKSVILVIASTDNTYVNVTPAQSASTVEGGSTLEKDREAVIVQHRLDTLTLTSSNDLTGTVIRADKPIAVYGGHECGNVPVYISSCSHLVAQMPPVRVWGYCFIASSFMGRKDGSYVKFVVAEDGTYVEAYENDDALPTYGPLSRGMFRERYLGPGQVLVLKSNHPIIVAQFSSGAQLDEVGAPFMIVLPSLFQLVSEVPFYSKNITGVNYAHYITITVPSQYFDEDAIVLDGYPIHSNVNSTIQSPGYICGNFTVISLEVDPGHHYLQHTTPGAGFLLSVYGFAPGASYGYSPGFNQVLPCDGPSISVEADQE